ncbi:MAG TPA: hypothetical protein PLJ34_10210, partial [Hyphomicrobiales bacterium]|nr:hypothetical protein [Hyphomicrobiales bacterium]
MADEAYPVGEPLGGNEGIELGPEAAPALLVAGHDEDEAIVVAGEPARRGEENLVALDRTDPRRQQHDMVAGGDV